ncbi:MAG TPA: hypothetical protein VHB21_16190, partial [Minicystis sp.]|nr:hypothetical protein [Minicystis sp.]
MRLALRALVSTTMLLTGAGCAAGPELTGVGSSHDAIDAAAAPVADDVAAPVRAADGSFTVAGVRYLEMVTGGAGPDDPLPMVVALHGHGGSAVSFEKRFTSFPGRARFIVMFGVEPLPNGGYEWLPPVRRMPPAEMAARLPPLLARVATAVQRIERARPTIGRPVVVGFSQGAVLSYGLAVLHGDVFSTACPMAGQIPDQMLPPPGPGARCEIHGFHGEEDDTVRYAE